MQDQPAIGETSTRSPVQFERPSGIRHGRAAHLQGLLGSLRARKVDETVTGVAAVIRMRAILEPPQLGLTQRTCHESS